MKPPPAVSVDAHSGCRGEEEPRTVEIGGEHLGVRKIVQRWREPEGRFFRVITDDGVLRLLLCREPELSWCLIET